MPMGGRVEASACMVIILDVFAAYFKRGGAYIGRDDARCGKLGGNGAGDAAASAAQVENAPFHAEPFYGVNGGGDHDLGIHARDENVGSYGNRKPIEFPRACDIRKRLACKPSLKHGICLLFNFNRGIQIHIAH